MQHLLRAEAFRLIRDRGPMSPAEIARVLEVDVATVSYHVRQLRAYDCVEEVENRPVRGAVEHFYRATEQHRVDLEEWAELAELEPEHAEALLDDCMQLVVDDYTESRQASVAGRDEEFWITRTPLLLDPEGLAEALEAAQAYEAAMGDIASRSAARRAEAEASEVPVSSSILLFKMPARKKRR
jgi:predicted ArsR family transcriptional regulator